MKVLIIANHWIATGGIEQMILDTVSAFHNREAVVQVWAIHDSAERSIDGIRSAPFAPSSRIHRGIYFRLTWKLKLELAVEESAAQFDLIIVGHLYLLDSVLSGCRCFVDQRPRIWVWVYGIEAWGNAARKYLHDTTLVDRILSISQFTADQIIGLVEAKKLSIVRPSVDTSTFRPASRNLHVERDTMLIVGRLSSNERYKGHDTLLRLLPRIEQGVGFRVKLSIVGDGNDRNRLEASCRKLGLEDRVTFKGKVSLPDLISEYQRCAVFVMPSRVIPHRTKLWTGEGFGIVYLEAQACGRPVIASSEGGAPEAILENISGILVNPNDDENIVTAVSKLLRDKDRADEMGRNGRTFVDQLFSRNRFESQLWSLVQNLNEGQ